MSEVLVHPTRPEDFPAITQICREVYPETSPWGEEQLASHLKVFPRGQLVAEIDGEIVGMAASLILRWDDYEIDDNWRDITDHGMFTNHEPAGHTLYGAEIMVRPSAQGKGVGSAIYKAREDIVRELGLWRIRAGARLRDYHRYGPAMPVKEYVRRVRRGELFDRTLSFQLKRGFRVVGIVHNYLRNDPESLGHAALIEWLNRDAAGEAEEAASEAHDRAFL